MATISLAGSSGFIEQYGYHATAITKSDTDVYDRSFYVYVGTTGDVAIIPSGSTTAVTFKGVPAGSVIPCRAQKVMSTNTTASDLVALS